MKINQIVRGIGMGGGISLVAYELQRNFNKLGINNNVIASYGRARGNIKYIGRFCGRLERALPLHLGKFISVSIFTFLSSCMSLNLRKQKNSIILVHNNCLIGDIHVTHGVHKRAVKTKIENKQYKSLLNPLHYEALVFEYFVYKHGFNFFIAVSNSIKNEIIEEYGVSEDKITVVPNGVDTKRFNPENTPEYRDSILKELGLAPDTFLLLFAGHEFRRKGLGAIIQALPYVRDERVALAVLGQDSPTPYEQLAGQEGISDRIHFLGTRPDIECFMAAADLFVFPTDYEPFGLVGIEAMASGTPVLATEVGGIVEYLKDDVNGLFINRNPEDIARKISSLLNDTERRKAMGKEARKTAEGFAWERIAMQYLAVIQEVAKQKSAGSC